jgi:hypothetical protein
MLQTKLTPFRLASFVLQREEAWRGVVTYVDYCDDESHASYLYHEEMFLRADRNVRTLDRSRWVHYGIPGTEGSTVPL